MSMLLSNKLTFKVEDSNANESEFSISNINPAISDTSLLRTAATQVMTLSDATLRQVILTQELDITND